MKHSVRLTRSMCYCYLLLCYSSVTITDLLTRLGTCSILTLYEIAPDRTWGSTYVYTYLLSRSSDVLGSCTVHRASLRVRSAMVFENEWFLPDLGSGGVRMSLENEGFFFTEQLFTSRNNNEFFCVPGITSSDRLAAHDHTVPRQISNRKASDCGKNY